MLDIADLQHLFYFITFAQSRSIFNWLQTEIFDSPLMNHVNILAPSTDTLLVLFKSIFVDGEKQF